MCAANRPETPFAIDDGSAPLVSVIIAAFNAASSIEETCRSAVEQTYPALEIIVVDDGSTDETSRIVERLAAADPRIRLIRQENLGVAAARNRAVAAAAGEFIAPLDADDIWVPTKIEAQVRRFQAGPPDAGMVYSWWVWIDLRGAVLDQSPRWLVEGRVLERLVEINFTGCASVPMYRRSCIEAVGGYDTALRDRGCQGCEDWDLAIRVAERYSVLVEPANLVGYRRHPASMSAACDAMWRSHHEIMATLAARHPSISPAVLRRSHGQFALYLAGVSFWSGGYVQACRWVLRAPLALTLAIAPHVVALLARRGGRRVPLDVDLFKRNGGPHPSALPDALIPYDRIYGERWNGRANNRADVTPGTSAARDVPASRVQRGGRAIVLLVGFAVVVGLIIASRDVREVLYAAAAIVFRYAVRIANGKGFAYNDGDYTNGASAPLYTLVLAALHWLGSDLEGGAVRDVLAVVLWIRHPA